MNGLGAGIRDRRDDGRERRGRGARHDEAGFIMSGSHVALAHSYAAARHRDFHAERDRDRMLAEAGGGWPLIAAVKARLSALLIAVGERLREEPVSVDGRWLPDAVRVAR